MKRKIIKINEELCNGCGNCIPNCPEGAIQIINNKARLVSDLFCDGLGACLGHCPLGAIEVEEREAVEYDERKVMENIIKQGPNVIKAHMEHLKDHGENDLLETAEGFLREKNIDIDLNKEKKEFKGCPGSRSLNIKRAVNEEKDETGKRESQLTQWPVQFHLISPNASYFKSADILLSADCVAYTVGDFHKDYLKGKKLIIACPKLDSGLDTYIEKITSLADIAKINTLTVMIMEVPCCSSLLGIAQKGLENAETKVPLKCMVVSIKGEILKEYWI